MIATLLTLFVLGAIVVRVLNHFVPSLEEQAKRQTARDLALWRYEQSRAPAPAPLAVQQEPAEPRCEVCGLPKHA